eukprot:179083-Prymnesium_polylepis.2
MCGRRVPRMWSREAPGHVYVCVDYCVSGHARKESRGAAPGQAPEPKGLRVRLDPGGRVR